MATAVATQLEELLRPLVKGDLPVRLEAWDGSTAGPADAPVVRLNSPRALQRILWSPGELGAAQAYVTGDLDIDGDLTQGLHHLWAVVRERNLSAVRPTPGMLVNAARTARQLGAFGPRPSLPKTQIAVRGRLHSKRRDREVIHHHYDLSNAFYSLILDAHMAYSCAYVTGADLAGSETADYTLEDAQADKLDLVCRKVGLDTRTGMRFLDIGCGWGSLSLYAAEHFGAQVTGVTISREQKAYIDGEIDRRGLGSLVEIRLQDYRDISDPPFDAVASLEMGEHVGERNYATYAETLARCVRPEGRVLIQQMSRSGNRNRGGGPFIESFIAPDMTMRPIGETLNLLEAGGLEVRDVHALREHYVWTVRAWQQRFEQHRAELTKLVGPEVIRVWDLYLAGGLLSFEQARMGVDQILMVRRDHGPSSLPAVRPTSWSTARA
ncbi:SAM-dependent methyltransferase [Demetria terragena]|uniref:SAM-dependent methyltransferase n=1 Tax=Demetria terragena TaxID=63959 RepID=UPI000372E098|nr:cyclopropane-fatty-acyl-phospholipid synthase family protein [Demetria terragena]